MMKIVAFFACLAVAMAVEWNDNKPCRIPPKYWCSSDAAARECGVERQCAEWNSRLNAERSLGAKPVNVTIYFESLCPDCQHFFLTQVAKARKMLPDSIMVLDFVPFGNAKMSPISPSTHDRAFSFLCQHGPDECVGNIFEVHFFYKV